MKRRESLSKKMLMPVYPRKESTLKHRPDDPKNVIFLQRFHSTEEKLALEENFVNLEEYLNYTFFTQ